MPYSQNITFMIDHSQVGGSSLTDFAVVVQGTFPELATVANGGGINNLGQFGDPADFVVAANPDGTGKYDFQIPVYDPATGFIEVYFRLPSLSASADQIFYFVYGDPAVKDFQGSPHFGSHPEWANYKGVYHFHGGFSTDASGSFAHGFVSGPTLTTAVVGTGLNFAGGMDVVDVSTDVSGFAFPDYARPMTFEFWLQLPSGGIPGGGAAATVLQASTFSGNFLIYVRPDFEGKGFATVDLFTASGEAGIPCPADGAWHHYMFAVNAAGGLVVTFDGVQQSSLTMFGGALSPNTSTALKFGNGFGALTGKLDEVRFSNVARPAGWGTASYNNQKSSSTFLRMLSGAAGYRASKPFTIDHTQVGGDHLTDFPIVVRGTYPELKSAANGGRIRNLIGALPCDFVVSPNADGSGKYDFEIAEYEPSTGTIEVWFRRPTLSASVDGTFYFTYDDATVTTYQGTVLGAHTEWDANYKGVYHLTNGFAFDSSTPHSQGDVIGPTQTTGVVGTALAFAGGTNVVDVPTFPNYARPMTFEFWLQLPGGSPGGASAATILQASSFSGNFLVYVRPDFESKGFATVDLFTAGGEAGIPYPADGAWHHYMFAVDASGGLVVTFDGVQQSSLTTFGGALSPNTSTALKFGNGFGALTGKLDEVRFSNAARPVSWGTASYNNQKTGSTFITAASPVESRSLDEQLDEQDWDESAAIHP